MINYFKSNIHINSTSINNDNFFENVSGTTSEAHVPPIENKWRIFQANVGKIFETLPQQVYKEDTPETCTEIEFFSG